MAGKFDDLVQAARDYAEIGLDQFEHFKFVDSCGNVVYVSVSYHDEYPERFDDVDVKRG